MRSSVRLPAGRGLRRGIGGGSSAPRRPQAERAENDKARNQNRAGEQPGWTTSEAPKRGRTITHRAEKWTRLFRARRSARLERDQPAGAAINAFVKASAGRSGSQGLRLCRKRATCGRCRTLPNPEKPGWPAWPPLLSSVPARPGTALRPHDPMASGTRRVPRLEGDGRAAEAAGQGRGGGRRRERRAQAAAGRSPSPARRGSP